MFIPSIGLVAKAVEDLDSRIADGVVARGDHASRTRIKGQNRMMQGWRGTFTDVNHSAARQAQAQRQGGDQFPVIGPPIPSDDDGIAFSGQVGLRVRKGFTHQTHESRGQGTRFFEALDGFVFVHVFQRRPAANSIGSEE